MSQSAATLEEVSSFVAEVRSYLDGGDAKVSYQFRRASKGKAKAGEWEKFEGLVDQVETGGASTEFIVLRTKDEDGAEATLLMPQKGFEYAAMGVTLVSAQKTKKR